MKWVLVCLNKYVDFNGRARLVEYWMFVLFQISIITAAMILDNMLDMTFKYDMFGTTHDLHYGYIYALCGLALFLPGLAVTVRRLHDVGKSGWMYFIVLIPIAGAIWLLVILLSGSQTGDNEYGPNPNAFVPDPMETN